MGHRTNYILVKNQKATIYYAHWDACVMAHKMLYGPDLLISYIQHNLDYDSELLQEIWCEASIVINLDQKEVLFWESEHVLNHPQLVAYFIEMLEKTTWAGWKLHWAMEGHFEIAQSLKMKIERNENNTYLGFKHWYEDSQIWSHEEAADALNIFLENHLKNLNYDPTVMIRKLIADHEAEGKQVQINPFALKYFDLQMTERQKIDCICLLTDWIYNLRLRIA